MTFLTSIDFWCGCKEQFGLDSTGQPQHVDGPNSIALYCLKTNKKHLQIIACIHCHKHNAASPSKPNDTPKTRRVGAMPPTSSAWDMKHVHKIANDAAIFVQQWKSSATLSVAHQGGHLSWVRKFSEIWFRADQTALHRHLNSPWWGCTCNAAGKLARPGDKSRQLKQPQASPKLS